MVALLGSLDAGINTCSNLNSGIVYFRIVLGAELFVLMSVANMQELSHRIDLPEVLREILSGLALFVK